MNTTNIFKRFIHLVFMKKILKILLGFVFLALPFYFILPGMVLQNWGIAALDLIKGSVTILVPLIGLALLILGFSELKN